MSYIFQDGQLKNLEIVRDNDRYHLTGIVRRCPTVRSTRQQWTFPHIKTALCYNKDVLTITKLDVILIIKHPMATWDYGFGN